MTALFFVLAIVAVFAILIAAESGPDDARPQLIQTGLLKWLVTGNWPAKVGAGLLLLGIGALLRYALINIEVPPALKLGSGLLIAAVLAGAAFALRTRRERRAIHVALAGAASGVAYLTAYAAYGFFGYVTEFNALAMLALVAVVTGVFAVSSNTMSIGILAMAGAYIAPAFALKTAGPQAVSGYYVAISALSLVMVTLRGWRGLIHLSFLFTIAGAVFFGWTAKFYRPEHYAVMQPLLLALAALHLAMPLVERRHLPSRWLSRFDVVYFVALPLFSAALMLLIAPDWRVQGALGLALLAAIWGITAGILKALKRDEALRHALVSTLLLVAALLCRLDDVPWLLLGLGLGVAMLALAPRLGWQKSSQELTCGGILLLGLLHASGTLLEPAPAVAFANVLFGKRLIAVALLAIAAGLAWRRTLDMAKALVAVAIGWLLLALADELRRLYFDVIPQLVYGMLLGLIAISALGHRWLRLPSLFPGLLVAALAFFGWWSASDASWSFALACLLLAPAVLLGLVFGRASPERRDDGATISAFALLPLVMVPWAQSLFVGAGMQSAFMAAIFATAGVLASWWLAPRWQPKSPFVDSSVLPVHYMIVAAVLIGVSLFHIERSAPAITFEILGLTYLLLFATGRDIAGQWRSTGFGTTAVVAVALVMQAMLLRLLGPDRVMTVGDLSRMDLPAVVSLMWATLGAGLAWWGTKRISRPVWAAGATLLVVSALKLVLLDFDSLGQLGNILALIAAGLVFMGVAWFAPIPPKPTPPPETILPPAPMQHPLAEPAKPSKAPPPLPQRPGETMTDASVAASSAPAADTVAAALPNRAVFVIDESEHVGTPAHAGASPTGPIAERATPASAAAAAAPEEIRERIAQAAQSVSAKQAPKRADDSSEGTTWVKVIVVLFVLAIGLGVMQRMLNGMMRESLAAESWPSDAQSSPASEVVEPAEAAEAVPEPFPDEAAINISGSAAAEEPAETCESFTASLPLPDEFLVLATGAYSGRKTGFQIDQSGHEATQIDVALNSPDKPVVLMLASYEPTIWNLSRTSGTQLLAVLVSGNHRQVMAGLDNDTPSMVNFSGNYGACGSFEMNGGNLSSLNPFARRVFGRPVDKVYAVKDGSVVVGRTIPFGTAMVKSYDTLPESFRDKTAPLAGRAGIEDALRKGLLRRSSEADSKAWADAVARNSPPVVGAAASRPAQIRAFVVLAPFTFPAGLYGGDSTTFLVPKDVPVPEGNPGHSTVYVMDSLACADAKLGASGHNMICPGYGSR